MLNTEYTKFITTEAELSQGEKNRIKEIEELIKNRKIPESYPNYLTNNWSIDCYIRRDEFIKQMGFSLLSWNWLRYVAQYLSGKRCLEIMSGTGSLTKSLQELDINIKATDNFSWDGNSSWNIDKNYWTDIENIDVIEAIEKYGKDIDVVVMSWAYMDDTAYRSLLAMRKVNPDCIMLYIGEVGGCTANNEFFDTIKDIEDDLINRANEKYSRWRGIHDFIKLGK